MPKVIKLLIFSSSLIFNVVQFHNFTDFSICKESLTFLSRMKIGKLPCPAKVCEISGNIYKGGDRKSEGFG